MAYKFDFVGDENYKLAFVTLPDDREFGTFPESRQFLPESEQLSQVGSYCFHEAPRGHATVANGVESEPFVLYASEQAAAPNPGIFSSRRRETRVVAAAPSQGITAQGRLPRVAMASQSPRRVRHD